MTSRHVVPDTAARLPMTTAGVAARLGLSADRVRQLARSGKLRCVTTASGLRIYDALDVDALAAERRSAQP